MFVRSIVSSYTERRTEYLCIVDNDNFIISIFDIIEKVGGGGEGIVEGDDTR